MMVKDLIVDLESGKSRIKEHLVKKKVEYTPMLPWQVNMVSPNLGSTQYQQAMLQAQMQQQTYRPQQISQWGILQAGGY